MSETRSLDNYYEVEVTGIESESMVKAVAHYVTRQFGEAVTVSIIKTAFTPPPTDDHGACAYCGHPVNDAQCLHGEWRRHDL